MNDYKKLTDSEPKTQVRLLEEYDLEFVTGGISCGYSSGETAGNNECAH